MRLAFWKPKPQPLSATIDEAALIKRVNRIMPLFAAGMQAAIEREPNRKAQKRLLARFHRVADVMGKLTGEELSAFLDFAESSIPEEFKGPMK